MVARQSKRHGRGVRQKTRGPSGLSDIDIVELGHRGDGIGRVEGATVYVPYTLPGEKIKTRARNGRGDAVEVITRSADRIEPACQYFGQCGGCDLQHMRAEAYVDWKRAQVKQALAHRDIRDVSIAPTLSVSPGTRRRVTFAAERSNAHFVFGYHQRARHDVLEIEDCPLLGAPLRDAIPALRLLSEVLLPLDGRLSLLVTDADNGFDLYARHLDGAAIGFDYERRESIAIHARNAKCARLTVNDDLLLSFADPRVSISGVSVSLPPGGFLQATGLSQCQLQDLVVRAVGNASSVVDLFCGVGTFSLPLARTARVLSVDSSQGAVEALGQTLRREAGLHRVTTNCRDLFDEPMRAKELNDFEAVVFDPPRKGAAAQAGEIAKSDVAHVAAVSCDPGTFARDAQILLDGGYRLDWVAPVDQFLWSHHIELVAAFHRE